MNRPTTTLFQMASHTRGFVAAILFLGMLLTLGCGGGGGGSPTSSIPTTTVTGTDSLVSAGATVQHSLVAGVNVFSLPTPGGVATFGLTVTNMTGSGSAATVKITALGASIAASRGLPARPAAALAAAPSPTAASSRLPEGQALIDQQLRQRNRVPAPAAAIRRNLVATTVDQAPTYADHRNEAVGDTVTLWIYARNTFGIGPAEYLQRQAVLRRLGKHCKIFVDPDEYNGLSAVTGAYAISEAQLDQMMNDFDNIGWDLIVNGYGSPWDIDQDRMISLVFSPLVAKNGFAGFFDTKHYEQVNADGTTNDKTNNRDMVAIWSPGYSATWIDDKWLSAARETCIHEFQHLVSYSARAAKLDFPKFVTDDQMEEVWLDEAMSTAVEARFRIRRGDPAGEDRFNVYAANPSASSLTGFAWNLESYGHLGLFGLYLWEQGGDDAIRNIIQNTLRGTASVDQVFSSRGGLKGMYQDWGLALLAEGLRHKGVLDPSTLPSRFRYVHDLALPLAPRDLPFGTSDESTVTGQGTSFTIMSSPAGYSQSSYGFAVEGLEGVTVSVIRLP
ncbi:MAG: hypothetical protein GX442_26765 [Candidatus Riflebacteria bacterium]|nr:hypothetical protein [Candidatus Riflebacteria bacterium]